MPEDQMLITQIAQGDQDALRQLYSRYQPRLWRYLWRLLQGDPQATEDALQEAFLAIWRDAGSYRGEATVAAWIFRIAHHCVSHAQRTLSRRPEGHLDRVDVGADEEISRIPQWQSASHEDDVIARLTLSDAMRHLSEKHREVLVLIFQQGFSLEEVAHILDIPSGTVKSRVSYARRALLKELASATSQEDRE